MIAESILDDFGVDRTVRTEIYKYMWTFIIVSLLSKSMKKYFCFVDRWTLRMRRVSAVLKKILSSCVNLEIRSCLQVTNGMTNGCIWTYLTVPQRGAFTIGPWALQFLLPTESTGRGGRTFIPNKQIMCESSKYLSSFISLELQELQFSLPTESAACAGSMFSQKNKTKNRNIKKWQVS